MKKLYIVVLLVAVSALVGCNISTTDEADSRDAKTVSMQQSQYEKSQPVPMFDWSLERHLVIELYKIRNKKVVTHSVWRSDYGMIEGDCPSYGYGIPYDTSLTNPLKSVDRANNRAAGDIHDYSLTAVEQPEPNGVYASKNTSATWVMCLGEGGQIEPVYVESKVTVYPGPVRVDYKNNRVTRSGAATVMIPK